MARIALPLRCVPCPAGLCILAFDPVFRFFGAHLEMPEVIFTTMGGLRGAVSLILAQAAVAEDKDAGVKAQRITAQVSPHPLETHKVNHARQAVRVLQACGAGLCVRQDIEGRCACSFCMYLRGLNQSELRPPVKSQYMQVQPELQHRSGWLLAGAALVQCLQLALPCNRFKSIWAWPLWLPLLRSSYCPGAGTGSQAGSRDCAQGCMSPHT